MRRYGRNQKRFHCKKIISLENRLRMESTRLLYVPDVSNPDIEEIITVFNYDITETGESGGLVTKKARLTVQYTDELTELCMNNSPVRFMGSNYIITDIILNEVENAWADHWLINRADINMEAVT